MSQFTKARSLWFRVIKKICWSNPIMRKITRNWSDEKYIKANYCWCICKRLDLVNIKRYTEKMQWLSLNDHSEFRNIATDKYLVR